MSNRTDIHAAKSEDFNPEAYTCLGVFDLNPGKDVPCPKYVAYEINRRTAAVEKAKSEGKVFAAHQRGPSNCGHCGAHMRYAALMVHENGEMIWVGEICLGNTFEGTRSEFRAMRAATAAQRKVSREIGIVNRRIQQAVDMEPILAIWQDHEDWARVARQYPAFVSDILSRASYRDFSEAQIRAAARAISQSNERKAKTAQDLEEGKIDPCPSGRQLIEGTIILIKEQDSFDGTILKMLVQTEKGWKVWGTIPSAIRYHVEKGMKVSFSANITPSENDPVFGFASRPTKAKILESVI